MREYTHHPLGEEIRSISGGYLVQEEKRIPFRDREVLVATGFMSVDSSCCGTGGCGFALVPGYVVRWKAAKNEKGEPMTEVEPIRDEEAKEALRKMIVESEKVQQVNFW